MSITAIFMLAAALAPILAGSILHRITRLGPVSAPRGFALPAAVLADLAVAVWAFLAEPGLLKLTILSVSGIATVMLMLVCMVFTAFPSEFSEEVP